jgi:hypothetical protein
MINITAADAGDQDLRKASDRQSIGSLSITACLLHPSDIVPGLFANVSLRLSNFTAPISVPSGADLLQIYSRIAVPQTQICRPVHLWASLSSHYSSSPASCLLTLHKPSPEFSGSGVFLYAMHTLRLSPCTSGPSFNVLGAHLSSLIRSSNNSELDFPNGGRSKFGIPVSFFNCQEVNDMRPSSFSCAYANRSQAFQ